MSTSGNDSTQSERRTRSISPNKLQNDDGFYVFLLWVLHSSQISVGNSSPDNLTPGAVVTLTIARNAPEQNSTLIQLLNSFNRTETPPHVQIFFTVKRWISSVMYLSVFSN